MKAPRNLRQIERSHTAEPGFRLKSWTTRKGEQHTGNAFDRHSLARLLANVAYFGQVNHKGKTYPGEQPAIVDRKLWKEANLLLQQEHRSDARERNRQGALLKGLLTCARTGKRMIAGYTIKGSSGAISPRRKVSAWIICRRHLLVGLRVVDTIEAAGNGTIRRSDTCTRIARR